MRKFGFGLRVPAALISIGSSSANRLCAASASAAARQYAASNGRSEGSNQSLGIDRTMLPKNAASTGVSPSHSCPGSSSPATALRAAADPLFFGSTRLLFLIKVDVYRNATPLPVSSGQVQRFDRPYPWLARPGAAPGSGAPRCAAVRQSAPARRRNWENKTARRGAPPFFFLKARRTGDCPYQRRGEQGQFGIAAPLAPGAPVAGCR